MRLSFTFIFGGNVSAHCFYKASAKSPAFWKARLCYGLSFVRFFQFCLHWVYASLIVVSQFTLLNYLLTHATRVVTKFTALAAPLMMMS